MLSHSQQYYRDSFSSPPHATAAKSHADDRPHQQYHGFVLDPHIRQLWASLDREQLCHMRPQALPTPSAGFLPTPASASTASRLDRRLSIDFLLNPSSSASTSSSPTPLESSTIEVSHHPQLPSLKKRRTRPTSPSPPPSLSPPPPSSYRLSGPPLSPPIHLSPGRTSSPSLPPSNDIDPPRPLRPKRFRRVSHLPAMGIGLLDVPDLDALASTPPELVVGTPSANHINKRTRKASQPASIKRARSTTPTTTTTTTPTIATDSSLHGGPGQGSAIKRRRTKSSTPATARSPTPTEDSEVQGRRGDEDGWQFVSHNFGVCDGRAVRLTRNREFIFKLRPAPH